MNDKVKLKNPLSNQTYRVTKVFDKEVGWFDKQGDYKKYAEKGDLIIESENDSRIIITIPAFVEKIED